MSKIIDIFRADEEKLIGGIHALINKLLGMLQTVTETLKAREAKIEAEYRKVVDAQEAELAAVEARFNKRLNALFEKHDTAIATVDAKSVKNAAAIDKAENILKAFAVDPTVAPVAVESATVIETPAAN